MMRGYSGPLEAAAWLALANVLLAFVLVYGLAAEDHHLVERVPVHLHAAGDGQRIGGHTHQFQQRHHHEHVAPSLAAQARSGADALLASPAAVPSTVGLLGQLAPPPGLSMAAPLSSALARSVSRLLGDQYLLGPPHRPPALRETSV